MEAEKHPTSQTTVPEPTQQRYRAQADERNAQKHTFRARTVDGEITKEPLTFVPLFEDPVQRRLLKKTGFMNVDEHLVNVKDMPTKARGEFERRQLNADINIF